MKVDLDFVIHEADLPGGTPYEVGGEDDSAEMTRLASCTLAAKAQPFDQTLVALSVVALQVVEQPAPLSHELEQPAAGMVIFDVGLEMLR